MTSRRDPLLTLSAVGGALVVAALVLGAVTGSRMVAFRSGSMSPTIPTGSVAVVHRVPATALQAGDVVTVPTPSGASVTHRIVELQPGAGVVTLQLRGDANQSPDPDLYQVRTAERLVLHAPWVGFLLGGLSGPAGVVLGGVYVLWLIQRLSGAEPLRPRHRARRPRARAGLALGVVSLVGTSVVAGAPRVWAAGWGDDARVTGTISTAAVVAPVVSCATLVVGSATLAWASVPGATGYELHYGTSGSATEIVGPDVTSKTFSGLATSGTFYVRARFGPWTSSNSNSKTYSVLAAAISTCT